MSPSVIIIEPHSSGVHLVSRCEAMGMRVVLLTRNAGARQPSLTCLHNAHRVEVIDTNDPVAVISLVVAIASQEEVCAIIPGFEYYVPLAAHCTRALGLQGPNPQHVFKVRLKDQMRAALFQAGLASPAFSSVNRITGLERAARQVGFPAEIKPINLSRGVGVYRVDSQAELEEVWMLLADDLLSDLDVLGHPCFLLEEYVKGPEYSVTGFVTEGHVHVLAIIEKSLDADQSFTELSHVIPARLDVTTQSHIHAYVRAVVVAVQLDMGPFHVDLRLTSRGPVLIEIAARLPDDHLCDLITLSQGVDLCALMVDAYLGIPLKIPDLITGCFAGITYFREIGLPYYTDAFGETEVTLQPGFVQYTPLVRPMETIATNPRGRSRLGCCIFTGNNYEELQARLHLARQTVRFAQFNLSVAQ